MTDLNFHQSLSIILDELNKKDWTTPLESLAGKFDRIPDIDYSFSTDLLNMLHSLLHSLQLDSSIPLAQVAAIRLASLECWTYRFSTEQAGHKHYLDPLTDSMDSFGRPMVSKVRLHFQPLILLNAGHERICANVQIAPHPTCQPFI